MKSEIILYFVCKKLPIGSFSDTHQKSAEASVNANIQEIAKKYFTHYDFGTAFHNVSTNQIVMAEGKDFLEYNIRKSFTNQ